MDFRQAFQETPAEDNGFALIDVGTYEAELMNCEVDLTRNPERLTLTYAITQEPYVGRKLFGNYNLEGRGIGFLKKDLDTLGLDYSQVGSPEDIATLVWDAMPIGCVVYVAQKEWNGKMYNNVYLNDVLGDRPAALETTRAPAPTNQKEADRRAAQSTQTRSTTTQTRQTQTQDAPKTQAKTNGNGKSATKPAPRNHAPQTTSKPSTQTRRAPVGEPDFEDTNDNIPF